MANVSEWAIFAAVLGLAACSSPSPSQPQSATANSHPVLTTTGAARTAPAAPTATAAPSATAACVGLSICPPPPPDAEGNPACYYRDGWAIDTSGSGIDVYYFRESANAVNRDQVGKRAARAFVERLEERTEDRDRPITVKAFRTQLKAIKRWGRSTPVDLSAITQPTLIANGDNDRMVPSALSEDMHRRIAGSKLIIYPNSGHGGIFQYHREFASAAIKFIDE